MGEYFWIIAIIVFFVAPILEKVLKSGRGGTDQQVPPGRRPPQRLPGTGPPARPGTPGQRPQDPAADLIPADLWEILTGQKRPAPPGLPPAPTTTEPPVRAESEAEARARERTAEVHRREALREAARKTRADDRKAQEVARRTARTSRPTTDRPSIGPPAGGTTIQRAGAGRSIDAEELAAEGVIHRRDEDTARRRRYDHDMNPVVSLETEPLDEPKRHAAFHDKVSHLSRPARGHDDPHALVRLGKGADLRRAMMLQEILGTPKGLE